jgi:hypothetical protein
MEPAPEPIVVAKAPWVPRPIPLGTVKATAVGAACALAVVGMCVGEARARSERVAHAPIVAPILEAAPPPPSATVTPPTVPTGEGSGQGLRTRDPLPGQRTPLVRAVGEPTVIGNGTLAPEVITRVVRQSYGLFRLCYQGGLRARPDLTGRVAVKIVIDRSGAVSTAAASSESTLPDPNVVACITKSFGGLSFPAPEKGIVTAVYRLSLTVE